jgi:putative ABC transport system substrate-binding protein
MTADPVELGLVASLNRPGGNITGIAMLGVKLETKRFELLHEFVPASALLAVLVNPRNPQVELQLQDVQSAARTIAQRILVLNASSEREIEAGFATLARERAAALLVCADTYFASQPGLFAALTARHAVPAIYPWRSHADAGGLMSYGTSLLDAYRQAGIYAGRVLKGEKPAELPVMQAAKFELVVNLKTAKTLGLDLPATLLAIADEVIE